MRCPVEQDPLSAAVRRQHVSLHYSRAELRHASRVGSRAVRQFSAGGLATLDRIATWQPARGAAAETTPTAWPCLSDVAASLRRSSRYRWGYRPCLWECVFITAALWQLGYRVELHVGVERVPIANAPQFHSWVALSDEPITDPPSGVDMFMQLLTFRAAW